MSSEFLINNLHGFGDGHFTRKSGCWKVPARAALHDPSIKPALLAMLCNTCDHGTEKYMMRIFLAAISSFVSLSSLPVVADSCSRLGGDVFQQSRFVAVLLAADLLHAGAGLGRFIPNGAPRDGRFVIRAQAIQVEQHQELALMNQAIAVGFQARGFKIQISFRDGVLVEVVAAETFRAERVS